ncbi:cellulase family glycosylhydrolase [Evansella sp. AB-rgal1]|uniref:cellulase family glycosylhydrolase n=1 Tax=Evansella sp. AB-rgal1 TaxID=3242696 RepID=UPI00359CF059
MEEGPDYTIHEDFLERITDAVDWSLEAGLYVMINIHHDSWVWLEWGMPNNREESHERFNAIWEQLADHFRDYPVELMFEALNEPRFEGSDEESIANKYLYDLHMSFYDIVRSSGSKNDVRPLVLSTLHATPDSQFILDDTYDQIMELDDPNLIATVHFYGFWPFSVNVAGYTHFDETSKNHINETFNRVYNTFTARGIPVVLGEYGLLGFDTHTGVVQQGEKLKFFEYMIHYAQQKEMAHMLWDNGQHFGRTSFQWSDPELYEMMQASWETRSATAESNFIYLKKNQVIEDVTLQLNLHGNNAVALKLNEEILVEGEDYSLNPERDSLTLKASILEELGDLGELGERGKITIEFNHGSNWYIRVFTYDTPTVEDAEGTVDDFVIPMQFNGNDVRTMEAVYEDGSAAGPHGWTTYKEFGYAFSPDYDENVVRFPYGRYRFFKESDIRNGEEVELTFYFWSGETLTYYITRHDEVVIGRTESATDQVPVDEPTDQDPVDEPTDQDPVDEPTDQDPVDEPTDQDKGDGTSDPTKQNGDVKKGEESKLPNTATSFANFILIGMMLLLIGGVLAYFSIRGKVSKG